MDALDPQKIILKDMNLDSSTRTFTLVLGIQFTIDLEDIARLITQHRIEVIKTDMYHWNMGKISLIRKIMVVRTLMLTKIIHILPALPDPGSKKTKTLQIILYHFLWNNGPHCITQEVVIQILEDGRAEQARAEALEFH